MNAADLKSPATATAIKKWRPVKSKLEEVTPELGFQLYLTIASITAVVLDAEHDAQKARKPKKGKKGGRKGLAPLWCTAAEALIELAKFEFTEPENLSQREEVAKNFDEWAAKGVAAGFLTVLKES